MTFAQRLWDYLTASGPQTAAHVATALGEDLRDVSNGLRKGKTAFIQSGALRNRHNNRVYLWQAIEGQRPVQVKSGRPAKARHTAETWDPETCPIEAQLRAIEAAKRKARQGWAA